ncbi:flagellar protein [Brevibacillus humidisoli]|uniref:TIGR02530 family flagellar biosynthesis protein n=1 Tax=Brevibacillus humidisoli TaxID=2895522 RepID=UPI001E427995|nr:TIGR02530 family flagellar biosynthesis protein [Brevibacillus humidisoli]UFJ42131.1 flagellar protein [Brevibacillus humidisoli]
MDHSFRVGHSYFPAKPATANNKQPSPTASKPFQQWLTENLQRPEQQTATSKLSFSQHALNRLEERGITLAKADLQRLEGAVDKAAAKGAKESLILMDNVAYVVSVVNQKVITAVDDMSMKENVFTNIDSAILL